MSVNLPLASRTAYSLVPELDRIVVRRALPAIALTSFTDVAYCRGAR